LHWYEVHGIGRKVWKMTRFLSQRDERRATAIEIRIVHPQRWVGRSGGAKSLPVFPDPAAARDGYVRIIDESGEDYLYPSEYFVPVRLPAAASKALLISA
jgi:hypothetical protein